MADEVFPSDLSGHFWTTLEHPPELDRWRFEIIDYQNNVLLSGLACSEQQAAAIVNAWHQVIATSPDEEDLSMDWVAPLPLTETDPAPDVSDPRQCTQGLTSRRPSGTAGDSRDGRVAAAADR
ncbi:hypothetical protein [Micromonospora sp. bgisy143]|uniref:hypothetical protein n=1 Tax=Micromonospora sp. bgisy143 TaxID=3413790 RepID=UPI003EBFBC54